MGENRAADGADPSGGSFYEQFEKTSIAGLEELLLGAATREEKAFYRALLNLKLAIAQEKIVGRPLV